jgi:hypothetical protein
VRPQRLNGKLLETVNWEWHEKCISYKDSKLLNNPDKLVVLVEVIFIYQSWLP